MVNATFQRFIPKFQDQAVDQFSKLAFAGLKDLNDAVANLHSQLKTVKTTVTTVNQTVTQQSTIVPGTTLPVNVNQQTASYTLQQSDFGGLVVFSGTGPYNLTLNNSIVRPFYTSVLNLAAANITVAPVSPYLVNNTTSKTVVSWGIIYFDGVNWWIILPDVAVAFVTNEIPSGAIDGLNVTFTLANTPNPASSLVVSHNGVRDRPTLDYSLTGATITYVNAPASGDNLYVDYRH